MNDIKKIKNDFKYAYAQLFYMDVDAKKTIDECIENKDKDGQRYWGRVVDRIKMEQDRIVKNYKLLEFDVMDLYQRMNPYINGDANYAKEHNELLTKYNFNADHYLRTFERPKVFKKDIGRPLAKEFADGIYEMLGRGIFKIQDGDYSYGYLGIICHISLPSNEIELPFLGEEAENQTVEEFLKYCSLMVCAEKISDKIIGYIKEEEKIPIVLEICSVMKENLPKRCLNGIERVEALCEETKAKFIADAANAPIPEGFFDDSFVLSADDEIIEEVEEETKNDKTLLMESIEAFPMKSQELIDRIERERQEALETENEEETSEDNGLLDLPSGGLMTETENDELPTSSGVVEFETDLTNELVEESQYGYIDKLKKMVPDFNFSCKMNDEFRYRVLANDWDLVSIRANNVGAVYNFLLDDTGMNFSGIYSVQFDEETGERIIDNDSSLPYKIDFDDECWKEKLENAMCEAITLFFTDDEIMGS